MNRSKERGRPSRKEEGAQLAGNDSSQSPQPHNSTHRILHVNVSWFTSRDWGRWCCRYGAAVVLTFCGVFAFRAALTSEVWRSDIYGLFGGVLFGAAIFLIAEGD